MEGGRGWPSYPRVASFKQADAFRRRLRIGSGAARWREILPAPGSPLAQEMVVGGRRSATAGASSRWKGGTDKPDGMPQELTFRRWRRFGESGAKLIWGGEAVAVRHDGKANPNQLVVSPKTKGGLGRAAGDAGRGAQRAIRTTADLLIGLQLTHSGTVLPPQPQRSPGAAHRVSSPHLGPQVWHRIRRRRGGTVRRRGRGADRRFRQSSRDRPGGGL